MRRASLLPLALVLACSSAGDGTAGDTTATASSSGPQTGSEAGTAAASTGTDGAAEPTTTSDTTSDEPTAGEPTTTTADATSSGGEPACGAGGVDDCCCFTVEGDAGHGVLSIGCPAAGSACEGLHATCPGDQVDCAAGDLTLTNPDSLECALTALADGTVGSISWSVDAEDGLAGRSVTIFVQSDRSAFLSGYDYEELEYTYTAVDRRMLHDPGFFSDCAAAQTDGERFDCVRQALAGEPAETCIDGFSGTAGRR